MARKRIAKKPVVSSSFDEEEINHGEEEEQPPQNDTVETQQQQKSSAGYGSEDDDGGQEVVKEKKGMSSQSSSKPLDFHGDSADSESNQASDFIIKPILRKRKPRPELELPKKTRKEADDSKPKRETRSGTEGQQRLWSDKDEIHILQGMIEHNMGEKPLASTVDLFESVKGKLRFNASRKQFTGKIGKLKKKYFTDVKNNQNGKDIFSQPHDLECMEMASKIWGAGGVGVERKSNAGKKRGKSVADGGGSGGPDGGASIGVERRKSNAGKKRGKSVTDGGGSGGKSDAGKKRGKSVADGGGSGGKSDAGKKRGKSVTDVGGSGGHDGGGSGGRELVMGLASKRGTLDLLGKKNQVSMKKRKRGSDEEVNREENEENLKRQRQRQNDEVGGKGNENEKDGKMETAKVVLNEEGVHEERGGKGEEEEEHFWEKYPLLRSSLEGENLPEDVKETAFMVMRERIPEERLLELEAEWESFEKAKLEVLKQKKALFEEQTNLFF